MNTFENSFTKIISIGIVIAVLSMIAIFGVYKIIPKFKHNQALEKRCMELRAEVAHLDEQLKIVRRKQQRFQDSADFVEQLARENRRVAPNEVVFIFE